MRQGILLRLHLQLFTGVSGLVMPIEKVPVGSISLSYGVLTSSIVMDREESGFIGF